MSFKFIKKPLFLILLIQCCFFLNSCGLFNSGNTIRQKPLSQKSIAQEAKSQKSMSLKQTVIDLSLKSELKFLPTQVTNAEKENVITFKSDYQFSKTVLKNGLEVYILERQDLPEVSISIIVESGKYQVNQADERLSPLVLKLLKQGTKKYTRKVLQERMTLLGRPLSYRQTASYSIISTKILPQDIGFALDLLAQQLVYLEPDVQAKRKVIEQQLLENKLTQSSGAYLNKLLFYQKNYPINHQYYHLQPNSDEIKSITKADLMDYYQRKYRSNRSAIIVSGNVDFSTVIEQINENFSDWEALPDNTLSVDEHKQSLKIPQIAQNSNQINEQATLSFIERKGSQQIDLLYGVVTVPRSSPDWISLKMLASLLGGGPSSRLFNDLREKQGLAYYISAQQIAGQLSSPFLIQTSVAHDKLIPALRGISNHLNYLCKNKMTNNELNQIKQQLSGEIIFKLQTNQQMVKNKIRQLENSLSDEYLNDLKHQVLNVTSEQLLAVANQYLCTPPNFIAVGDPAKLDKNFHKELSDYVYQKFQLPLH